MPGTTSLGYRLPLPIQDLDSLRTWFQSWDAVSSPTLKKAVSGLQGALRQTLRRPASNTHAQSVRCTKVMQTETARVSHF